MLWRQHAREARNCVSLWGISSGANVGALGRQYFDHLCRRLKVPQTLNGTSLDSPNLPDADMGNHGESGLVQLRQQRFRRLQVGGIKALSEPVVDREQRIVCILPFSLFGIQPCQRNRGAQFIGFVVLCSSNAY